MGSREPPTNQNMSAEVAPAFLCTGQSTVEVVTCYNCQHVLVWVVEMMERLTAPGRRIRKGRWEHEVARRIFFES